LYHSNAVAATLLGGTAGGNAYSTSSWTDYLTATGTCTVSAPPFVGLGPCIEFVVGSLSVSETATSASSCTLTAPLYCISADVQWTLNTGCSSGALTYDFLLPESSAQHGFTDTQFPPGTYHCTTLVTSGQTIQFSEMLTATLKGTGSAGANANDPLEVVNLDPTHMTLELASQNYAPSSVPEFPVGLALLFVLLVPALLILKKWVLPSAKFGP
jgi:hypothetical protein